MVCKPWWAHPWPGHPSSHSANSIKTLSTCRCARKIRRDHPAFVAYWYYVPASSRPGSARARALLFSHMYTYDHRLCMHALESPFRGCLPPWSNAPVDRVFSFFFLVFLFLFFPISFFSSSPLPPVLFWLFVLEVKKLAHAWVYRDCCFRKTCRVWEDEDF